MWQFFRAQSEEEMEMCEKPSFREGL
jgi:hypothetical protein